MAKFNLRAFAFALTAAAALFAAAPRAEAGQLTYAFSYSGSAYEAAVGGGLKESLRVSGGGMLTVNATPVTEAQWISIFGSNSGYATTSLANYVYEIIGVKGSRSSLGGKFLGNPDTQSISGLISLAADASNGYQLGISNLLYVNKGTGNVDFDSNGLGYTVKGDLNNVVTNIALASVFDASGKNHLGDTEFSAAPSSSTGTTAIVTLNFKQVPEPIALSLIGMGLVGLGLARKRRSVSAAA